MMIFARIEKEEYLVASISNNTVELFSSVYIEGFTQISARVFSKCVPVTEINELYSVERYCEYNGETYRIQGGDDIYFYLSSSFTSSILEVRIEDVKNTQVKIEKILTTA